MYLVASFLDFGDCECLISLNTPFINGFFLARLEFASVQNSVLLYVAPCYPRYQPVCMGTDPCSDYGCYWIFRKSCHQAGTRTYTEGVLGFLAPTKPLQGVNASLLVGILDTSGSFIAGQTKDKEVRIGLTTVLEMYATYLPGFINHWAANINRPTLFEYDKEWEPSPIFASATKVGKEGLFL